MIRKTITRNLDGEFRRMVNSGGYPGCYCWFLYRVESQLDLDQVVVLPLEESDSLTLKWLPIFREGIERFIENQATEGVELVGLRISLRLPKEHPIDTHHRCVSKEAFGFMHEVIAPELAPIISAS